MTTIVKRLSVLTLAGFLLAFMISGGLTHAQDGSQATAPAVQPANTNLPASQPVIQGTVSGAQDKSAGAAGSYCWPQTDPAKPECDVIDDPAPTAAIVVNNNDGILFTLDPAVPGPASLKGILLDDKTADGAPPQVDLSATGGIFTVESLNPGPHRLQITAVYPGDVEGNQPFITYVFTLSVSAGGANATVEATPVQVIPPTAEQPTAEQPTAEQPVATPVVVEPTVAQPTAEQPTVEQPTAAQPTVAQPTAEQPTVAQPTVAQPTAEQPTVVQPTAEQPTVVPPTVEPTVIVPPTAEQPTSQSINVQPTVEQPVAPTATPQPVTSSGGTNVNVPTINVPPASLIVNARTFEPIAYNTCVKGDQGGTVCINRPTNTTIQKVFAAAGDVAQITFGGPRPTSITVTQLSSDGTKTIGTQSLQGDNLVLYTLPAANGNFILDIQIVYPQGKVDYYFRLAIGN